MKTHGFVYIGTRNNLTKIGSTQDYKKRKRQLETGSGIKFEKFSVFYTYAYLACEKHLLTYAKSSKAEGEWFHDEDQIGYQWLVDFMETRAEVIVSE